MKRRYVLIVENENKIEVPLSKKFSLLTFSPEGQNIKIVEKKAVIKICVTVYLGVRVI